MVFYVAINGYTYVIFAQDYDRMLWSILTYRSRGFTLNDVILLNAWNLDMWIEYSDNDPLLDMASAKVIDSDYEYDECTRLMPNLM